MFAPSVAFVDLETTGTRAAADRITEIGIVRVEADAAGLPVRVEEWATLVDPEVPIPPEIQALTGITDAMVRGAPTFSTIAAEVARRLEGCVLVAHNARFDYGFLKHAFARLEQAFAAKVLCTVRLSRRLFPDASGHGLDAIIERHALDVRDRHRALGDARALFAFAQAIFRTIERDRIEAEVRRILRIPSLPPQLPPDALDAIPALPGVYLFYGLNELPLYVGKSLDLRERVAAHFTADYARETDLRLSQEIRRIEFETTAGELGALLREAALVKARMPAHNHALRRKGDAGVMRLDPDEPPRWLRADSIQPGDLDGAYGPFSAKRGMREALRQVAHEHGLCATRLGLERREGPCFSRQLQRCRGACVGAERADEHDARLRDAVAALAIPRWPFAGPALIREASPDGSRVDVHVVDRWQWAGTARDDGELHALLAAPVRPAFDLDATRLLVRLWRRHPDRFVPAPGPTDDRAGLRANGGTRR